MSSQITSVISNAYHRMTGTDNALVTDLAKKLNITGKHKEDKDNRELIKQALVISGNNKAVAINAILPGTFTDTARPYDDDEIDEHILNKNAQIKKLKQGASMKSYLKSMETEFGPDVFRNHVDKGMHYSQTQEIIPQIEFVLREQKTQKYKDAFFNYMGNNYNEVNDLLNGRIQRNLLTTEFERIIPPPAQVIHPAQIRIAEETIADLQALFRIVPPLQKELIVYRCWGYGITENGYREGPAWNYNQFLSTSFFKDFSVKWCRTKATTHAPSILFPKAYIMRITIPEGSRILPLIDYKKFIEASNIDTEYEILISNYGQLIKTPNTHVTFETIDGATIPIHHFTYIPPRAYASGIKYSKISYTNKGNRTNRTNKRTRHHNKNKKNNKNNKNKGTRHHNKTKRLITRHKNKTNKKTNKRK